MAKKQRKKRTPRDTFHPWAPAVRTANLVMTFGRHEGETFGSMPAQYLCWIITNNIRQDVKIPNERGVPAFYCAQKELDRRAPLIPLLKVKIEALDKLSLRCVDVWRESSEPGEGMYSWAERICRAPNTEST